MPGNPVAIAQLTDQLKAEIVQQGRRVQSMAEVAFQAVFARDEALAAKAHEAEHEVDRVDVAIEKAAVDLLSLACTEGAAMSAQQVRIVMTIVKVNNELERIADIATSIASQVSALQPAEQYPPTFRVLANSSIAILRDCISAMDAADPKKARAALMSQSTIAQFKAALIRDVHENLRSGKLTSLPFASALHDVANACETLTDHCTNICEQVLYVATGTIMRHMEGRWQEVII